MDSITLANRFIDAIETGDVTAARACFHDDAEIWHNYDNKVQTPDQNMATLQWMIDKADRRHYAIKRLEPIEGGYLQQHTLEITDKQGKSLQLSACALVTVKDGLIQRIEEWIDPSPLAHWLSKDAEKTS